MQIQCLNKPQGNYVRRCWGTTPISGEVGLTARLHPLRSTTPVTSRCTRCVALHPLRSTTPVTSRYTRSERVHCLRIGCIAYGSGAAPTLTSPNADHSTTRANFNTTQQAQHNETTAAPARMADNTPSRTTSPTYRIEDSTLFEYKPHRTRAQTRKHTPNPSPQPSVVGRRKPQKIDSPRPP